MPNRKRPTLLTPEYAEKLGKGLRRIRQESGLRLIDVERAIQMNNSYLSKIETGGALMPPLTNFLQLSELYGFDTLSEFFAELDL